MTTPPKLPPFFLLAGYVCRRCGGPGCAFCRYSEHASPKLTPLRAVEEWDNEAKRALQLSNAARLLRAAGFTVAPPAEPDPWELLREAAEALDQHTEAYGWPDCARCDELLPRIRAALAARPR